MTDGATRRMTQAELLERIATSHAAWRQLIALVPAEHMVEPGFAGDWSLKDVIAHITVYERWTADNLEADARGETGERRTTWGPPDGNTADMDARNAAYHGYFRDVPIADILSAADEHHQRLVAAIERLTDGEINDATSFAWTIGYPVWQAIEGNSYEHYDDHQPGVRAWLESHSV